MKSYSLSAAAPIHNIAALVTALYTNNDNCDVYIYEQTTNA